ncbi:FG-GAP-like repeat-containing protein [bacterium]|nr:FG-GAP-like repeat-containing protein [bacterium]
MALFADSFNIDSFNDAVHQNNLERAEEIIQNQTASFSNAELQQIQAVISQHSPQGNWIPMLKILAEKSSSNPEFMFFLSQAMWRSGDEDGALKVSGETIALATDDLDLQYKCAAIARTLGKFDVAKQRIDGILQQDADYPDALFLLGSIYAEEGENDKAQSALQQVLKANPNHLRALFELGKLETRLGNDEQAVGLLQKAVDVYPFFREAYSAMRTPLSRLKRKDEFTRLQDIMKAMQQWNPDQYMRLRYMYENAYKIPPEQRAMLAQELISIQQFQKAKLYLSNLYKQKLTDAPLMMALAQLHYNDKEFVESLRVLDAITDPNITSTEPYLGVKAWSLLGIQETEQSRKIYETYQEKFKNSPNFQALGKALSQIRETPLSNQPAKPTSSTHFQFRDVTEAAGLSGFQHRLGHKDKRWIIDAMGSGLAVGDYDNDGDDDIYFVNGRPDLNVNDGQWTNALYRNDGGKFTDVTSNAGVGDTGWGMCAVFGDVNNDGWLDLFVGNYGADAFYINNGDGTFTERAHEAGVDCSDYAAAAVFGDVDADGDLDLYVGNYVEFDPEIHAELRDHYHGIDVMRGPMGLKYQDDKLYLNNGDGTFQDYSKESQINISEGRAMGASMADFDLDGDLDLYVANDSTYNHVLYNKGNAQYDDSSFFSGAAVDESGREGASMGVATGDYNNDGFIDIFVTAYEQEADTLYQNKDGELFTDVTGPSKLSSPSQWLTTWGTGFADFDCDGFIDIYTVNGHTYPQVEELKNERSYKQGVSFYRNTDGEHFFTEDVSLKTAASIAGRGSATLDYDNDGDLDIIINCIDSSPHLLENMSNHGNWLKVKLEGTSAQTFGARVVVKHQGQQWTRCVDGGSSYLSQNSQTLHFGLGEIKTIDELTVYWTGKPASVFENISTNQTIQFKFSEK